MYDDAMAILLKENGKLKRELEQARDGLRERLICAALSGLSKEYIPELAAATAIRYADAVLDLLANEKV